MLRYARHQDCSLVCWDRPAAYLSHSFPGIHQLCWDNLDTRVEFHNLNWTLTLLSSGYPEKIHISVLADVMSNQENAVLLG